MRAADNEWWLSEMYARVCVCPVRQFNVQFVRGESIYCSKNIGRPWWKGKEAGRDTESLVGSRGRRIGGRAGWKVEKKGKTASIGGGEGQTG